MTMSSVKELFQKKIIPGLYALLFVAALLLLSILLVRRNIYLWGNYFFILPTFGGLGGSNKRTAT